jgi:hypothetical protein
MYERREPPRRGLVRPRGWEALFRQATNATGDESVLFSTDTGEPSSPLCMVDFASLQALFVQLMSRMLDGPISVVKAQSCISFRP